MLRVSETVGDSLADDGGPDARDLEREMGFMWEDALEGIANLSEVDGGRDSCGESGLSCYHTRKEDLW